MVVLLSYIGIFAGLPPPSSTACGAEFDNSRLVFLNMMMMMIRVMVMVMVIIVMLITLIMIMTMDI